MPTGIQTYHLELHHVEPIDWLSLLDDDDYDYNYSNDDDDVDPNKNIEKILVGYGDYDIEITRNTYTWKEKIYIQSMIEIYKGELQLRDTYRFEPDEYHPDGIILTSLPLEVTTTKDPVTAEYKLIDKAKAIIDRLDENGSAILEMCNKGNILEMAA